MNVRIKRMLTGLSLLVVLAGFCSTANAQIIINTGHRHHRHYHRRHWHHRYHR